MPALDQRPSRASHRDAVKVLSHYIAWTMGLAPATTQTTTAERDCLARYATGRRCLVEIGVWHGVTTRRLRAAMHAQGVLSAVDPFPVGRLGFSVQQHIAHREVDSIANGRVDLAADDWCERPRAITQPVDFVFIDGDHSEHGLLADWRAWSPLVEPRRDRGPARQPLDAGPSNRRCRQREGDERSHSSG